VVIYSASLKSSPCVRKYDPVFNFHLPLLSSPGLVPSEIKGLAISPVVGVHLILVFQNDLLIQKNIPVGPLKASANLPILQWHAFPHLLVKIGNLPNIMNQEFLFATFLMVAFPPKTLARKVNA
jgi:hypothetical protein